MVYKTDGDAYAQAIEDARKAVEKAHQAYARGGSLDAVNKANRALAGAHDRADECAGLRVKDTR
jgi:hypothetical protein